MKYSYSFVAGLAAGAAALPTDLSKRQFGFGGFGGGSTSDELSGECRPITFIFARGSTEPGNMGATVGPATCSGLKEQYGEENVACQGVGGAYTADIGTNALPQGTTSGAIEEAQSLFSQAATQCPDTVITGGGYSQGAAVMTGAVSGLSEDVKARTHGIVLYGSTRNAQEGGKIPDFPPEEVLTICAATDGVCGGALLVTAGHLTYQDDVPDGVEFIASRVEAAGGPGSASGTATGASPSGAASGVPAPVASSTTTTTGDSDSDSLFGGFFDNLFSRFSQ